MLTVARTCRDSRLVPAAVVFRRDGLIVVSVLCALHKDVGIWLEPTRVVEGVDAKSDEIEGSTDFHV
jgi:hypothetical protein